MVRSIMSGVLVRNKGGIGVTIAVILGEANIAPE